MYATLSTCASRGVYELEALPRDLAEKLLRRGEAVVTELGSELSRLLGIEQLEDYQYLRVVLLRE